MPSRRRQASFWPRSLLVLAGVLALLRGLATITNPQLPDAFEPLAVALLEAVLGSLLLFAGVLLGDRSRAVMASGLVCGTVLVAVGDALCMVAGTGALVAGVWAYTKPWESTG